MRQTALGVCQNLCVARDAVDVFVATGRQNMMEVTNFELR
jgi:hypothetical protein